MDYYALKICSASPNIELDFTVQRQERVCGREVGDAITRRRAVWNVLGVQLRGSMDTLWDLPPQQLGGPCARFPEPLSRQSPARERRWLKMVPGDHVLFFPLGSSEAGGSLLYCSHQGCCIVKPSLMTEHNHSVYFFKTAGKDGLIGPL